MLWPVSVHDSEHPVQDWYPKRTLGDLPREAAARWPGNEALVFGNTRLTFAELNTEIDRASKALMGAGVERRPRRLPLAEQLRRVDLPDVCACPGGRRANPG